MKRNWILIFLLLGVLGAGGVARAEDFTGIDARAYAMGDAYTVLVDDATALFWNPAALAEIGRYSNENSFTSTMPQGGEWIAGLSPKIVVSQAINSAYQEAEAGGTGDAINPFTYLESYDDGLDIRNLKVTGTTGFAIGSKISLTLRASSKIEGSSGSRTADMVGDSSGIYSIGFALGNRWDQPFGLRLPFEKFDVGWGLHADIAFNNYSHLKATEDLSNPPALPIQEDPPVSKFAIGPGLDLGLWGEVNPMVKLGFVTHNLLSFGYSTDGGALPLTRDFRLGAALTPPIMGMKLAAEVGSGKAFNAGIELQPLGKWLSLRGGMVVANGETEMRSGLGLRLGTLRLDVGKGKKPGDLNSKVVMTGAITF